MIDTYTFIIFIAAWCDLSPHFSQRISQNPIFPLTNSAFAKSFDKAIPPPPTIAPTLEQTLSLSLAHSSRANRAGIVSQPSRQATLSPNPQLPLSQVSSFFGQFQIHPPFSSSPPGSISSSSSSRKFAYLHLNNKKELSQRLHDAVARSRGVENACLTLPPRQQQQQQQQRLRKYSCTVVAAMGIILKERAVAPTETKTTFFRRHSLLLRAVPA